MSGDWGIQCKVQGCKNKVKYSNRSYVNSIQYGLSRPLYCEEHQQEQTKMRGGLGAPYFHVPLIVGDLEPGPLGFIEREEVRVHEFTEAKSQFDENKFGATPDKIYEIAEWFVDPNHRVAVVVGPTGSGKSTAIPYWLVYPPQDVVRDFGDDFFTRDGQILVTLPRIAALEGIANFVGIKLMGGTGIGKGMDVGYSYSADKNTDWRNVLIPQTDGQFINSMVSGNIGQYGVVLIDEAHERSENIETILRLLKERMALYPNLKVIIASATIDKEAFYNFFVDQGAKIVELEGKRVDAQGNPVSYQQFYASEDEQIPYEDIVQLVKVLPRAIKNKTEWLLREIIEGRKTKGDILIFLHSKSTIDKVVEQVKALVSQEDKFADVVLVYPFHRDLESADKNRVLYSKPKEGKLKVIVSTNYAEASLTIDTLVYVIDSGVEIRTEFDAEQSVTNYPAAIISKANARQRWGRVGRNQNGEVFCLYTESQFEELFIEYPIPAMQRSSMENVVINAKAAGIPDVNTGWLGQPPEEEINRSTQQLVEANALADDGSLTSYGVMIRNFSYSPRLIDILLAADDLGVSVEVATLLPVIKNGGQRRLFNWRFNWDAYTKQTAFKRHRALLAGVKDDIDFILKLYKAWDELPWLDRVQLQDLSDDELDTLRKQWADIHFVNHKTMLLIRDERNKALDRLRISHTEKNARKINLYQVSRVRSLLSRLLKDIEMVTPSVPYVYISEVEPQPKSLVTVSMFKDKRIAEVSSWLDITSGRRKEDDEFSRLFTCFAYPIGYRFSAKSFEDGDGISKIYTIKDLTRAKALEEQKALELSEDEDFEETEELEGVDIPDQNYVEGINIADFFVTYKYLKCIQLVETDKPLRGPEFEIEIIGYEFQDNKPPTVWAKVISHPEPFDKFVKRYNSSDEAEVEVVDVISYPNDYSATLVVRELLTQLEVLIEAHDLTFTRQAYAVTQIPVGATLKMNVEHIDTESRRVRLSYWEVNESVITDHFETSEGDEESSVVQAKVIEVRTDGKIVLALDMGSTGVGVSVITTCFRDRLPKEVEEVQVGDEFVVKVIRKTKKTSYVDLVKLPEKAHSQVFPDDKEDTLSWKRKVLRYTGRMSYNRLFELKTIASDLEFQKALENLYWRSNQVFVDKFIDNKYYEAVTSQFIVGQTVGGCTVLEVNDYGVRLEVDGEITAWLPRANMTMFGGKVRPSEVFSAGDKLGIRILKLRLEKKELEVELVDAKDLLDEFFEGEIYTGTINGVNQAGIFVDLAPSVTGRVKHLETFRSAYKSDELYHEGDQVRVKVLTIDRDGRKLELTMKIPDNDPINKVSEGDILLGTIVQVKDFGAFVELLPGLEGMMHRSTIVFEGRYVTDLRPFLTEGMRLYVKILSISWNSTKQKTEISLAFYSNP